MKPKLYLAKPDKTIVSTLQTAYGISYHPMLGGISELTFTVPINVEIHHEFVKNPDFSLLLPFYLLKYVCGNLIEWFVINQPSNKADDSTTVRNISCLSLPSELSYRLLNSYESVAHNAEVVLTEILQDTVWSAGFISPEFLLEFRTVSGDNISKLDLLIQLATTFNAVIKWDTENRTISLYKPDDPIIMVNKGLIVSYGNLLKGIEETFDSSKTVTRFRPIGENGITINSVNVLASDYLENYAFFLDGFTQDENGNVLTSSKYMSDGLCQAIFAYNALVNSHKGEYSSLLTNLTNVQVLLTTKNNELAVLQTTMNTITDTLDTLQGTTEDTTAILAQMHSQQDLLNAKIDVSEIKDKYSFNTNDLIDNITSTPLEELSDESLLTQARILSSYKVYKKLGDSLSTLVNATKADSNGVDKNIAGIVATLNRVNTVKEDKNIETDIFETKNIASTFLKYGVEDPLNNFINKYFPYSNSAYTSLLSKMENIKGSSLTEREIEYLYSHATAWYMSNFTAFNINEKKAFIEKFADVFVAKRNLIKDYKFNKYIRYVGKNKDNLIPKLELYSNITITKEQVRDIKLSWETMIMSTNPEISKLGKDLVEYAYFTTNFNFNFTGFSHLVPPSYLLNLKDREELTYADNLHKLLPESNADNIFDNFVLDFVQNQHNNKIIPTINQKDLKSKLINKSSKILTSFTTDKEVYGRYVKVRDRNTLRTYVWSGKTVNEAFDTYNLIPNKGYTVSFVYSKVSIILFIPAKSFTVDKKATVLDVISRDKSLVSIFLVK